MGRDAAPSPRRFTPPPAHGRKPIAVVTTVYRPLSHSYHIGGRFLYGYTLAGKPHVPNFQSPPSASIRRRTTICRATLPVISACASHAPSKTP